MGWDYNSHIVCMCIIMRWSRNHSASYAHTNYVTIIVPSQSCLLSFLHHPYMHPFSICKIFHLLVDINCSVQKYLPIIMYCEVCCGLHIKLIV